MNDKPVNPVYTTTPAEDRVSSADSSKFEPIEAEGGKEVTAQFDHLATRNPVAMELKPEAPQHAGEAAPADAAAAETLRRIPIRTGQEYDANSAPAVWADKVLDRIEGVDDQIDK